MMTAATSSLANEAVTTLQKFYEIADARPMDAGKLRSFFDDAFVDHDASHDGPHADTTVGLYAALADGSPDSRHELVKVLPSGENQAIIYWRFKGTNTNNLFGMPTTDPVRDFDIAGIEIFTVENGKITDMWHVEEIHKLVEALTAEK